MRILIVEDEYNLADVIAARLKKENYSVDIALDGETGLDDALSDIYDLIILDVMLPKMNGYDILKEIRKNGLDVKVIMLTAKSQLEDKLTGFENGANDYLTKPFHIEELLARVNVQLRQNVMKVKDYMEAGDLRLYQKQSKILCTTTNEEIEIMYKEFLLLEYLMTNKNMILSKDQIYTQVWGIENDIESNNLEAYVSFVRKKLKIIGSTVTIKAIRGMGYRLEVKDEKA